MNNNSQPHIKIIALEMKYSHDNMKPLTNEELINEYQKKNTKLKEIKERIRALQIEETSLILDIQHISRISPQLPLLIKNKEKQCKLVEQNNIENNESYLVGRNGYSSNLCKPQLKLVNENHINTEEMFAFITSSGVVLPHQHDPKCDSYYVAYISVLVFDKLYQKRNEITYVFFIILI